MNKDFAIIETILWENGEYFLLGPHIERLKRSAEYFRYNYVAASINKAIDAMALSLDTGRKYKVRILLNMNGKVASSADILEPLPVEPVKAGFSCKRTDKNDIFYYHKTTNRSLYDNELNGARAKGYFDIIFTNQEDQVTEGAITNIIVKKNNEYFTPPVSCGILNGIFRQHLMQGQTFVLQEKILYKEDLLAADEVCLINSVRKYVKVFPA